MDECPLYSEPALYDLLFPSASESSLVSDEARRQRYLASERFYVEEAKRSGGPVLELGCGSGRLTLPVAADGIEIVGADLSAAMLEAARAKAAAGSLHIRWLQVDMRSFDLPGRFAAIFIPGNSLLHLHTIEDLKKCLANARRHLQEGGRLVFDISKYEMSKLNTPPPGENIARSPVLSFNHPVRGEVSVEERARYDAANQIRHVDWYFSSVGAPDFRVISYALRIIFPQELFLLLDSAGFTLDVRYGEFTREPFNSFSPRQVCVCSIQQ